MLRQPIPESVKEVTYDDSGNIIYTYDDWSLTTSPDDLFEEGQIGFTDRKMPISGDGEFYKALLFHKDENGVITGRIVVLSLGVGKYIQASMTDES